MKIAIDCSPLSTGHKYRGTGYYTLRLKEAFEKYFSKDHEFVFFTNNKDIPSDVDIVHYPYFDPFSYSVPLFSKKKTIVTVLDLTPIIFPKHFPAGIKGGIKWERQKVALRNINGIITDSNSAKKDIHTMVGIRDEKITVAYLAAGEEFQRFKIQDSRFKKIREKYKLPDRFALYVGDVTWNKNLPRIVEAAKMAKIPLVMVGKALVSENYDKSNVWNRDLEIVQNQIKKSTDISALGFVPEEDLVMLYNLATVFVMPSIYEGFGLPILEAMQCGTPVITSKEGSLPEISGNAAYIVDAYDSNEIAKGLEEVFHSINIQKELSVKGMEQAEKFSWKKTAQETILAYEKAH